MEAPEATDVCLRIQQRDTRHRKDDIYTKPVGTKSAAAPDTGWAWVIAIAAFFIYVNTFGANRSSGVFYVAVVHAYDVNRKEASWPFTICHAFLCLTGPLAGILNRYLSIRKLTLIGCGVCASGVILSFFADDIASLSVALGALQGIGLGINMIQNSVIINQYFIRHRATASGIAYSGGNIGSFIYPPLIEYFIHEFGLKGAFLLTGGMMLNALVAASFYRTPEWLIKAKRDKYAPAICKNNPKNLVIVESKSGDYLTTKNSPAQVPLLILTENHDQSAKHQQNDTKIASLNQSNYAMNCNGDGDLKATEKLLSASESANSVKRKLSVHFDDSAGLEDDTPVVEPHRRESAESTTNSVQSKRSRAFVVIRENLRYVSKVILHPMFAIICVTNVIFFWIFMTYVMFIVDFAMDRGIQEEEGVILLSSFGISDIIGRLGSGWISDRGIVRRKNVTLAGLLMMALFLNLTPFVWDFNSLMVVCLAFGFAAGCVIILTNVEFADYLGLEKLPIAIGCASFFGGMVAFTRPALIGFFRDSIGSYDGLLHVQGCCALFGAICWLFEPMVQRRQKRRKLQELQEETPSSKNKALTTSNLADDTI